MLNIVGIVGHTNSGKDTAANYLISEYEFVKISLADPFKRLAYYVFGFTKTQLWGPSSARNTIDKRFTKCDLKKNNIPYHPGCDLTLVLQNCDKQWGAAATKLLEYAPAWLAKVLPNCAVDQEMLALCKWFVEMGDRSPKLSPRVMLQLMGSEWGRNHHKDIWLDLMMKEAALVMHKNYAYSMLRGTYPNTEENAVKPLGIVVPDVRFKNEILRIKNEGGHLIHITRPSTQQKAKDIGIPGHKSELEQNEIDESIYEVLIVNKNSVKELYESLDLFAPVLFKPHAQKIKDDDL